MQTTHLAPVQSVSEFKTPLTIDALYKMLGLQPWQERLFKVLERNRSRESFRYGPEDMFRATGKTTYKVVDALLKYMLTGKPVAVVCGSSDQAKLAKLMFVDFCTQLGLQAPKVHTGIRLDNTPPDSILIVDIY